MAVAFRVLTTNAPSGTAANTVVSKDASVANGDFLLAGVYVENDVAVTTPAGWTLIGGIDHAAVAFDLWLYYKFASAEGASWTWTHASAWEMGLVAAYTGVDTTTPLDATFTSNQGTSTTGTATGITTVTAGAMLVAVFSSFEGIAAQAAGPSSMTERYDGAGEDIYWADVIQAAAGASGNKVLGTALSAANHWVAALLALRPAGVAPAVLPPFPAPHFVLV
jgi:hypothetical protein